MTTGSVEKGAALFRLTDGRALPIFRFKNGTAMTPPTYDDNVATLSNFRFSAHDVCAAVGISGDVLTNYLTKTRVVLSSASPGRGRQREFCLIDVYQLALLADLVRLTRDAPWSARALECLIFQGNLFTHSASEEVSATLWGRWQDQKPRPPVNLCAEILHAHPMFWSRPTNRNWLVFGEFEDVATQVHRLSLIQAGSASFLTFQRMGVFFNATKRLADVDGALLEILNRSQFGEEVDA